ncbi:23547_t:CDS:2, partial [Gigaspora rosea]
CKTVKAKYDSEMDVQKRLLIALTRCWLKFPPAVVITCVCKTRIFVGSAVHISRAATGFLYVSARPLAIWYLTIQ